MHIYYNVDSFINSNHGIGDGKVYRRNTTIQDLDKKLAQIIKTIWENYLLVEKTQKISIDQFVKHQREQH